MSEQDNPLEQHQPNQSPMLSESIMEEHLDFSNEVQKQEIIETIAKQNRQMLKILTFQCNTNVKQIMQTIASKDWPSLRTLDFYHCEMGIREIQILAKHGQFKQLRKLQLNENPFKSQGVKLLVKMDLPVLQKIFLGWDRIGNQGAVHLTKSKWPHLDEIALGFYISNSGTTDIGLHGNQYMASYTIWKELKILWMRYNLDNHIGIMSFVTQKLKNTTIYLDDIRTKTPDLQQVMDMKQCDWIR